MKSKSWCSPGQLLMLMFAGWINRHQQAIIAYQTISRRRLRQKTQRFAANKADSTAASSTMNIGDIMNQGERFRRMLTFDSQHWVVGTSPRLGSLLSERGHLLRELTAQDRKLLKGIIHREVKLGNVKVTPDSKVNVQDFRLAKQAAAAGPPLSTQDQTQSTLLAVEGTLAGTFQFMSPEQLRDEPIDARSDVFSFGVLLYEMLSGLPFNLIYLEQPLEEHSPSPAQELRLLIRFLDGLIRVARRLADRANFFSSIVLIQRDWFLVHSEHPPRVAQNTLLNVLRWRAGGPVPSFSA